MKQKSDYSFWEHETHGQIWDVCIVGGGITGVSTGISLLEKKPDSKILIVDRWHQPLGASTRNAGFSCFGSPSEILDDIRQMGEEAAFSLVRKRYNGLRLLQSRLNAHEVQYETHGGYEVYNAEEFDAVAGKLQELNNVMYAITGEKRVFSQVDMPFSLRGFSHAVFNPLEGQLHPGYMMENLRKVYSSMGGKMMTGYDVTSFEDHRDVVAIYHPHSVPVRAKKLIITTNAFAARLLPELDVHGARNIVLVTSPVQDLPIRGCFHFDKGYYYFRNIGNRVLLGGARNTDLENENTEAFGSNTLIRSRLEAFLFDHIVAPGSCEIEFEWSGIIGVGKQKSPIIQAFGPNIFAGVRLSGMGIALASVIGEELSELVWQHDLSQ